MIANVVFFIRYKKTPLNTEVFVDFPSKKGKFNFYDFPLRCDSVGILNLST